MKENTPDYWKEVISFYRGCDANQREVFRSIIRQTIIDTISHVFGVLDGSSTLSGGTFDVKVTVDDISTEDEL